MIRVSEYIKPMPWLLQPMLTMGADLWPHVFSAFWTFSDGTAYGYDRANGIYPGTIVDGAPAIQQGDVGAGRYVDGTNTEYSMPGLNDVAGFTILYAYQDLIADGEFYGAWGVKSLLCRNTTQCFIRNSADTAESSVNVSHDTSSEPRYFVLRGDGSVIYLDVKGFGSDSANFAGNYFTGEDFSIGDPRGVEPHTIHAAFVMDKFIPDIDRLLVDPFFMFRPNFIDAPPPVFLTEAAGGVTVPPLYNYYRMMRGGS